ncbi:TetR/AcrR family transcriptional regulator [Mycolicibacterium mengxianglii]|uniref:TetR/AcrR family transcriptional regulator n=1 Tax=Mycolicibacterium mengxianglii TaxID=2736649 RepID=UPI001E400EA1|nr:helix-turn-helix domain-containing protein [Mycolicibacterium mengxianglii]
MTAPATANGVTNRTAELTPVKLHRRRWAKTDATQQRILDAAADVFREHGFAAATIGEVVTASGASIGSIYHHFGGKTELFLAIHERLAATVGQHIADTGQPATFDAAARGYLEAVWIHRHIAVILAADDVPPGYERVRRDSMQAWFRSWISDLDIDASAAGALLTRVLIAILTESAAQVMTCADLQAAAAVTDAAIAHLHRLRA